MDLPLALVSQRSKSRISSRLCDARDSVSSTTATGLYRAFTKLEESGLFIPFTGIPKSVRGKEAPAKGMPEGSVVKMELMRSPQFLGKWFLMPICTPRNVSGRWQ